MSEIIAISCSECDGSGFVFFGDNNDYDVMVCDCVPADEDPAEYILGM
jgi:hypothetical protein